MDKKKVGILTFHRADNLGAVLQAYALQDTLINECGVQAEIIDYKCEEVEKTKTVSKSASFKGKIKVLSKKIYYRIKSKGLKRFRKQKLKISGNIFNRTNINNCVNDYDIFISGSDQVWNLECSGNDMTYFLDFAPESKVKASYAASIGTYKYTNEEQNHIHTLLNGFSAVSVRENTAKLFLENIGISDVAVMPDPVFLLDVYQWKKVMSKRLCRKKYMLVYLIQEDVNVIESAEAYAKKHGLKIINNKKSIEFILHNSPAEFLSFIYNSECVFTNSFHGTALSLIFSKPLCADIELKNGGINNRINELLTYTNAQKCILSDVNAEPFTANIQSSLDIMKNNALNYFHNVIQ